MQNDRDMSQSMTRWERANSTKWGIYLTEIEKRAILKAHDLSETPTTALEIGAEGGRWSRLLALEYGRSCNRPCPLQTNPAPRSTKVVDTASKIELERY